MHPAIPGIVALAREFIAPKRIWLFGSRARGEETRTSDIDLAFLPGDRTRWGRFVAEVEENAQTLLDLDLVDIDRCSPELRAEILAHGQVIFDA